MAKKKAVPPIYPTPETITVPPQKIAKIDRRSRTIIVEGSPSPELVRALQQREEFTRWRFDFRRRLKQYTETCLNRILPFLNNDQREAARKKQLPAELPDDVPAEVRDAVLSLHTLNRIVDELVQVNDWPDEIDRALCLAIDLGQLLQRGQVQIDVGEAVARGRRNHAATQKATASNQKNKVERQENARLEFVRRMQGSAKKTAVLNAMSRAMETDGVTPKYGSIATLKRWSKDWPSITSTR